MALLPVKSGLCVPPIALKYLCGMSEAAFNNAQRKMDANTEAQLAELIMKDVSQLTDIAQDRGVTAYRLRPVQREKLNERFLQGTLRSVQYGVVPSISHGSVRQ